MSRAANVPEEKLRDVVRWRESEVFTAVEKLVLEFAEALTRTPANVSAELRDRVRGELGDKGLVELTTAIAWECFRARFNRALDIQAEGYSRGAFCVLPEADGRAPGP